MVCAKDFFTAFVSEFNENRIYTGDGTDRTYLEIYRNDEPAFTHLANKVLIRNIVESFGLTAQHEYFRIDTVGWVGKYLTLNAGRAKEIGLNRHLWDLKIAVEHENNKADWLDEVIKLIHIKCPLKVVIGYNHCDLRGGMEDGKLDYAAECMNKIEAFSYTDREEYLIIIGNGAPKKSGVSTYDRFDYRGYLYSYSDKAFKELKKN